MKSRNLKVYHKAAKQMNRYVMRPEIRLHGKWLEENGFQCGQKINVLYSSTRIVITSNERVTVVL